MYQVRHAVTVVRVEDSAKAALINPEQSAASGIPMPYPVIIMQRLGYALDGQAVELRFLTTITDQAHFVFS